MPKTNQTPSEQLPDLSEDDRERIAHEYLASLTPGFQKLEDFKHLARLGGLDTVEVLPVRASPEDRKNLEVLLVRRPADDPFWPNLLHVAGSIIREDDPIEHEHDYKPALSRAMAEMGGVEFTHEPIEAETVHRRSLRGREITVRFWGEVAGEAKKGEFYDAANVLRRAPELGIFDSHAAFIERVANNYGALESHRND